MARLRRPLPHPPLPLPLLLLLLLAQAQQGRSSSSLAMFAGPFANTAIAGSPDTTVFIMNNASATAEGCAVQCWQIQQVVGRGAGTGWRAVEYGLQR